MSQSISNDGNTFPERHVVLVSPQIHWNTGNIGRTCVATGAYLHLVEPLGFSLDNKKVKRAGLDYWKQLKLNVWEDFASLHSELAARSGEVILFSKTGAKPFWAMPSAPRQFLVFGSETRGLPENILSRYSDAIFHIPISKNIRSLNLSTAVGIALYESLRRTKPFHAWTSS